jgi:hypothetical protein
METERWMTVTSFVFTGQMQCARSIEEWDMLPVFEKANDAWWIFMHCMWLFQQLLQGVPFKIPLFLIGARGKSNKEIIPLDFVS